jgi:hypothetical protein
MELSLHLCFQLSCSIRSYSVGTTTRFRVTTMEALAPWAYHRILWLSLQ